MEHISPLWRRFLAGLIDGLVLSLISYCAEFVLPLGEIHDVLIQCYFVLLHWKFGATVGKAALRIEVVDSRDGSHLTFGQALIREMPFIILVIVGMIQTDPEILGLHWTIFLLPVFVLTDGLVAVMDHKNRSIHDRLARTIVVYGNHRSRHS